MFKSHDRLKNWMFSSGVNVHVWVCVGEQNSRELHPHPYPYLNSISLMRLKNICELPTKTNLSPNQFHSYMTKSVNDRIGLVNIGVKNMKIC